MSLPDEKVRILTYRDGDTNTWMINFPGLAGMDHMESDLLKHNSAPHAFRSLGTLDVLPLELQHEILRQLVLRNITTFKSLNSRAQMVVTSLPEYRDLASHAPGAIRALASTGIDSYFTLSQLFDLLCVQRCSLCNDFGDFLFLPALTRCCARCSESALDLMPMSRAAAKAAYGLTDKTLEPVPKMTTLPGDYGILDTLYQRRLILLSRALAQQAGCRTPTETPAARDTMQDVRRYMAVTPFPYLDRKPGKVEHGIQCKGCERVMDWRRSVSYELRQDIIMRRDRLYTTEGFLTHFERCREVQELWAEALKIWAETRK